MRLLLPFSEVLSIRTILSVLVMSFTFSLCVGPADAASEPGTITIVMEGEPANLDFNDATDSRVGQVAMSNIVEGLVEFNPADGKITPRLATSWKQADPHTWQFSLRKGVKFHDGTDFNADAVLFSIRRFFDSQRTSKARAKFFSNFKIEGKALDHSTLEIKLDRPEPLLVTTMAFLTICSPNTPLDNKLIRNPIGTGPYKLAKWDAGSQIVLERFDGYWGKQPPVKKAIYVWRGESSVRAAMVEIGEADLTPNIAPLDANRPGMDISYLNAETVYLRFGGEWEPPLNDRRVRMAFNYAIDRKAFIGSVLSKDVVPASQLMLPSVLGYNTDLKVWPYDPQKAKQLLNEARKDGVPVDKEVTLFARPAMFPGSNELMEALMTMYKTVGINVKLKFVEQVAVLPYRYRPYATNVGPFLMQVPHGNNTGDAVFTFLYNFHCKGNSSSMCDKMTDDLIEKAQAATGDERKKLWQAAGKRVNEDIIPGVMLYHLVGYARVGKRINFKPSLATQGEIQLSNITFK